MKNIKRRFKRFKQTQEKGFTLIEFVVVIAIMAILSLVAIPSFASYRENASNAKDLQNARIGYTHLISENGKMSSDELKEVLGLPDSDALTINGDIESVTVNAQTYPSVVKGGGENGGSDEDVEKSSFEVIKSSKLLTNYVFNLVKQDFIIDGVTETGILVYTGNEKNVVIPEYYEGNKITSTVGMFADHDSVGGLYGNIESISGGLGVTNTSHMFRGSSFNGDLVNLDMSSVIKAESMFNNAKLFNKDISGWDVSNIEDMNLMFMEASSFNSNIGDWNTNSLKSLIMTFNKASSFNPSYLNWNTSKVTAMRGTFEEASSFNGDLSSWDTSKVNSMEFLFSNANSFRSDISMWSTENVENMRHTLFGVWEYNHDLSGWNVGKVEEYDNFSRETQIPAAYLPKFK